jgi:hypothetical protein
MPRIASLVLVATSLATALSAQATWTQVSATPAPTAAGGTVGVSDGAGMYVFGGLTSNVGGVFTYSDRLWRFDGINWIDLTPAAGLPPARHFYAACWDIGRQRYVLFGGQNSPSASSTLPDLNDTWEWNGTSWTQMTPANSPSPRRWAAMYYDVLTARCILFGGNTQYGTNTAAAYSNETWAWDGVNWTQLTPATSPLARARGFFSYDPLRLKAIYYGGRNTGALSDTWQFDGTNWTQLTTNAGPGSLGVSGLFAYGATYDPLRDRHVIFGGTRTGGTLAGTWEFDGVATWVDRGVQAGGPPSRTGPSLAYVTALGRSVLWGGFQTAFLGDTWTYQSANLASATTIGTGCAGTAGITQLTAATLPWTGSAYTLRLSNLGGLAIPFVTLGFSTTSWSGGSLPFALNLLVPTAGAGCNLLSSPDVANLVTNNSGTAELAINVPANAALAGLPISAQGLVLEVVPTELISASNAVSGVLGVR